LLSVTLTLVLQLDSVVSALMAFSIWPCRSDEPLVADWVPIALVLDVLWPAFTSLCGTDPVELVLDWLLVEALGVAVLLVEVLGVTVLSPDVLGIAVLLVEVLGVAVVVLCVLLCVVVLWLTVASLCGNVLVELELLAGGWVDCALDCEDASPIGG
jgi:hypothetical protein